MSSSVQAERRPMNATISTASAAVKTGMPSTSLSIQSAEIKNLISSPSLKTKYIKLNNGNRSLASFQQQMPCSTTSSNSTLTNNNTHPVFSSNDCATTTFQNYSLSNNADLNSTNNRFGELNDLNLFNEAQPNIFQQQGLLKIAKNNIDYNDIQIKCSQDKLINVESTIIDKLNSWRRQNELKKDNDLPSILDILNEANNSKFETILNQSSILPLTSNPPSMAALAIAAEMLKNRQNSLNITENFNWCANFQPEELKSIILNDPHSPSRFKVNGVVSNQPEFAKAFNCCEKSKMNPKKRCSVW